MVAIIALYAKSAKHFDTSAASVGPAGTITANRCSFFALEFARFVALEAASFRLDSKSKIIYI